MSYVLGKTNTPFPPCLMYCEAEINEDAGVNFEIAKHYGNVCLLHESIIALHKFIATSSEKSSH